MIANYHTHTFRCGHAEGHEREYIEAALRAGYGSLGFSDHTPYDFFDVGPRNRPIRMKPEELPEYTASLRVLAAEYSSRIRILTGVEAEYYPRYFPRLVPLLKENGVQYMILGQHYLNNEVDGVYCGRRTDSPADLDRYVGQTCEALSTGLYTYFAHPELLHFTGDEALYTRQMRRLCRAALDAKAPLEINLLGIRDNRHYPNEAFWRIVGEEGNEVVIGADAHRPGDTHDPASEAIARQWVKTYSLNLLETLPEDYLHRL